VAEQVQRRALGGEQRPHRPLRLEHRPPATAAVAVVGQRAQLDAGHDDVEDGHGDADPGERAVGAGDERRHALQVGRHGRDGRDVLAAVEVLGDRPADEVEHLRRVEAGARERGGAWRGARVMPAPGARTRCRAAW
jgi:hypothetical protein